MYYQQALSQSRQRRLSSRTTRTKARKRNSELGTYSLTRSLGPVTTTLFLAIIVGVLALLYLTQITKTSVYGYQINDLSQAKETLLEQQQELQIEAARLQSVARIERSGVTAGLEPETNVSYER